MGENMLKVHCIMHDSSGPSLFFPALTSCFSKPGMIFTVTSHGVLWANHDVVFSAASCNMRYFAQSLLPSEDSWLGVEAGARLV